MGEETRNVKTMTQSVGGAMEGEFHLTPVDSDQRETIFIAPPNRVIPIIFLPGVMGSNLRMSRRRKADLKSKDDIAWRPDNLGASTLVSNVRKTAYLSPRERQMKLDPADTEVDYYRYTEDQGRFDPSGTLSQQSDIRHNNVPETLQDVGLLKSDQAFVGLDLSKKNPNAATAAQKARWRGWSEISFGDYSGALSTLEDKLNRIISSWYAQYKDKTGRNQLDMFWISNENPNGQLISVTGASPKRWGAPNAAVLDEKEVLRVANCLYPVHAMGYNWLQSNAVSAKKTATRIRDLIKTYQTHGHKCDKVILVTHSMGGILARALIHPEMGGLNDSVLGIYHSVQPVYGSAAAYKRVRSGVDGHSPAAAIIGNTGQDVTAVFANAPGPLELLPTPEYGQNWLKVQDRNGKILAQWPANAGASAAPSTATKAVTMSGAPIADIYTQAPENWWRLINPQWTNPAGKTFDDSSAKESVNERIADAQAFHAKIKKTFHPHTYASYSADVKNPTHGNVIYKIEPLSYEDINVNTALAAAKESPLLWKLVSEDGKGDLIVALSDQRKFKLKLLPPQDAGDGTVPSEYSAAKVKATVHFTQSGYDHQGSYKADSVSVSMLYAMIKIANTAEWWKA
ncbi:esterase/lipase family protein [Massilia sp. CT11-108]|uniref:esterase/lipase family protein n=1 Tax=Massilia sp. CT11-108 TaxID=3393900 RepID=UPI0039A6E264